MKTYDLNLLLNIRRALYILTFTAFLLFVVLFYFAVKEKDNPIGAEIEISKVPLKLSPDEIDEKQAVFTVINDSNFDWNNVSLTINDRYIAKPGNIVAGESRVIRVEELENIDKIPIVIIPTNRSINAYQAIDSNELELKQDLFTGLSPMKSIQIHTNSGRILYDYENNQYIRIGKDNHPTNFIKDLKSAF